MSNDVGFIRKLWEKFKKNWIANSFAVVGFFAVLSEIWPVLYLLSPSLAVVTVLFYNNVITFFGGGLLLVTGLFYLAKLLKRLA